jgi:hypothetical protein
LSAAEALTIGLPVAPWRDYDGNRILHGARLRHPMDEEEFVAIRLNGHASEEDAWRAVYSSGMVSYLTMQIGDKGQASLVPGQVQP